MFRLLRSNSRIKIGTFLSLMAMAVALPLLIFVVILLLELGDRLQEESFARTIDVAEAMAESLDSHLQEMRTTLKLLSTSPDIQTSNLSAFQARTQQALNGTGQHLLLVREDGQQLLNTRVPFGSELGPTAAPDTLTAAYERGSYAVSGVFFGETSKKWVFNVILPLETRYGNSRIALILTQNAEDLRNKLQDKLLPQDWTAAVIDSADMVVSGSAGNQFGIGSKFDQSALEQQIRGSGLSGMFPFEQEARKLGFASVRQAEWRIAVWGPANSIQSPLNQALLYLSLGGAVLILLAILAAYRLGLTLKRPMRALLAMAEGVGRGEIVSPVNSKFIEVNQVAEALSNASFDRSQAEERHRVMLLELAHRTKNMLAVLQSMVRRLAGSYQDINKFEKAVENRISGLARSLDLLTGSRWEGVPVKELVSSHVSQFLGDPSQLRIEGDELLLRPEVVQNFGLTIHELALNAAQHGALSTAKGRVTFRTTITEDGMVHFEWKERGGPKVTDAKNKGFGLTMIDRNLAAALLGKSNIAFEEEGLYWKLSAPQASVTFDPAKAAPQF